MSKAKICLWALALSMLLTGFGSIRPTLSRQTEAQSPNSRQKRKEHGKLYKQYGSKKKLPDLAAKASGDFSVTEGVGQKVFRPGAAGYAKPPGSKGITSASTTHTGISGASTSRRWRRTAPRSSWTRR